LSPAARLPGGIAARSTPTVPRPSGGPAPELTVV